MRIAVCAPQVPFERGGAEIFTDDLVAELRARGHEVDLVTVPFKWYPGERVLTQAFLWRLLDLDEARRIFATSRNVADRLRASTGLEAELMPHPPQELDYPAVESGDFFLSVGRLDRAKRNDLLLEALAADASLSAVIVGDGPDRLRLESLAREQGLNGQVR